MNLDLRYLGASEVPATASGATVRFSPNLARSRVFFDAELAYPLRFREAMSALHDVVVGDLRFKKKDKTAYLAWKSDAGPARRRGPPRSVRQGQAGRARAHRPGARPARTWRATSASPCTGSTGTRACAGRTSCRRSDPRALPPPRALRPGGHRRARRGLLRVLLEGRVGLRLPHRRPRGAPRRATRASAPPTSTTRSDLYEHFQTLRSYRSTRLLVDPAGFEVKVEGRDDYREEKIDLPPPGCAASPSSRRR